MIGSIGYIALALSLILLGLLSRRLGHVTQAGPQYIGLFVAGGLVGLSGIVRLVHGMTAVSIGGHFFWILIYNGLPALGFTMGLVFAWRYWSWLWAERD
ncbi:MAG: hypothetical protein ACOYL5_05215 [Phototrophicaceae bacterium]|jgi:hypothetical protein